MVAYYKVNAKTIRDCLQSIGLTVFGGVNAPFSPNAGARIRPIAAS